MTQATPTQELAAKDLHGYEWRFKHIFRGNCFCNSTWLSNWRWVIFKNNLAQLSDLLNRLIVFVSSGLTCSCFRSTSETFAYNRLEHICYIQETGCRRCLCVSEVAGLLLYSVSCWSSDIMLLW